MRAAGAFVSVLVLASGVATARPPKRRPAEIRASIQEHRQAIQRAAQEPYVGQTVRRAIQDGDRALERAIGQFGGLEKATFKEEKPLPGVTWITARLQNGVELGVHAIEPAMARVTSHHLRLSGLTLSAGETYHSEVKSGPFKHVKIEIPGENGYTYGLQQDSLPPLDGKPARIGSISTVRWNEGGLPHSVRMPDVGERDPARAMEARLAALRAYAAGHAPPTGRRIVGAIARSVDALLAKSGGGELVSQRVEPDMNLLQLRLAGGAELHTSVHADHGGTVSLQLKRGNRVHDLSLFPTLGLLTETRRELPGSVVLKNKLNVSGVDFRGLFAVTRTREHEAPAEH